MVKATCRSRPPCSGRPSTGSGLGNSIKWICQEIRRTSQKVPFDIRTDCKSTLQASNMSVGDRLDGRIRHAKHVQKALEPVRRNVFKEVQRSLASVVMVVDPSDEYVLEAGPLYPISYVDGMEHFMPVWDRLVRTRHRTAACRPAVMESRLRSPTLLRKTPAETPCDGFGNKWRHQRGGVVFLLARTSATVLCATYSIGLTCSSSSPSYSSISHPVRRARNAIRSSPTLDEG